MCPPPLPPLHDLFAEFSFASSFLLVACSSLFSGIPVPEATPISEAEWLNLLDSPDRDAKASDLARGLDNVTLEEYSTAPSGPTPLLPGLLAAVDTAFSNLPSLEASFRPSAPPTSTSQKNPRKRVPSWKTLRKLCDVAASRPALVERMRERVEAILQRPGPTLLDSDGTWLIVLFEVCSIAKYDEGKEMCLITVDFVQSPVFTAKATPDPEVRHRLQARLIGLSVQHDVFFFRYGALPCADPVLLISECPACQIRSTTPW